MLAAFIPALAQDEGGGGGDMGVQMVPVGPDNVKAIKETLAKAKITLTRDQENALKPIIDETVKAMEELNKLNRKVGTATDAMCTFLVINTSNVQIIPATVIAIRASAGSSNPTEILGPALLATTISTAVGIVTVHLMSRMKVYRKQLTEGKGEA